MTQCELHGVMWPISADDSRPPAVLNRDNIPVFYEDCLVGTASAEIHADGSIYIMVMLLEGIDVADIMPCTMRLQRNVEVSDGTR